VTFHRFDPLGINRETSISCRGPVLRLGWLRGGAFSLPRFRGSTRTSLKDHITSVHTSLKRLRDSATAGRHSPAAAEHPSGRVLSAASALFLSSLIIVAIYRQKTHQVFQKHLLLVAVYLLVCAIIFECRDQRVRHDAGPGRLQDGVILSKRVQATFDYLFGIAIGAFIFVATTPSIGARRDFVQYMKSEFPNSYVFYLFLMIITIITIIFSKVTIDPSNPAQSGSRTTSCSSTAWAVATLILYAPYRSSRIFGRRSRGKKFAETRT